MANRAIFPSPLQWAVLLSLMAHGLLLASFYPVHLNVAFLHQVNARLNVAEEGPKPANISSKMQQKNDLSQSKQPVVASEILRDTDDHPPVLLGDERDGVREMRLSLARFAKRHKNYPLIASLSGWEGRVEIALIVLPAGQAVFNLHKSSGFEILDNEALRLVEKAFQQALIPASLRSHTFEILLPIEFRLE